MLHIRTLIRQFEQELRTAADLTDFFSSAKVQASLQLIVQQMSLEVIRRIKSNESLDELTDALRIMNRCLTDVIKLAPSSALPLILTNGSAVMILLYMIEQEDNPIVLDQPS